MSLVGTKLESRGLSDTGGLDRVMEGDEEEARRNPRG